MSQRVSPVGFKIALELFVKSNVSECAEVPINFGVRQAGESKLDSKVMLSYLQHLFDLYRYKYPALLPLVAAVLVVALIVLVRAL